MDKVLKCGNPTLIVGNKFGKILGWTSRTQGMRQQKGQLESYIPPSALWALSLIFMRSMLLPAAFTLKNGAWLPISLGKQAPTRTGHRTTIASEGIGGWSARLMTVQVTCLRTVLVPELLGLFGNKTPKHDKRLWNMVTN